MPEISGFTVVLADRVKEITQTTGTGTYSLDGAATGFRTFVAGIGSGNRCPYVAQLGSGWEVGIGTVTSGAPATLSRDVILASSNSNNAVSWPTGTKDIYLDVPADLAEQIFPEPPAPDLPRLRASINTTSGTSHDFTGIDADTTLIHCMFDGLSTNGNSALILQLGTSGSFVTSGYRGSVSSIDEAVTTTSGNTNGFFLTGPSSTNAGLTYSGLATLVKQGSSSNVWSLNSSLGVEAIDDINWICCGTISLGGTLTRVRLTTSGGANAFDAGSFGMREQ